MPVIALDFDDTFTSDSLFWTGFCYSARSNKMDVVCVTAREDSESQRRELESSLPTFVKILFAGPVPKRQYATSQGVEVNIWIDDYPESIGGTIEQQSWEEIDRLNEVIKDLKAKQ